MNDYHDRSITIEIYQMQNGTTIHHTFQHNSLSIIFMHHELFSGSEFRVPILVSELRHQQISHVKNDYNQQK